MEKKLVLETQDGTVIRTFNMHNASGVAVFRRDNRRLELWENEEFGKTQGIEFDTIAKIDSGSLEKAPLKIGNFGELKLLEFIEKTETSPEREEESSKLWWALLALVGVLMLGTIISLVLFGPQKSELAKEEMKIEVVQILKKVQMQQEKAKPVPMQNVMTTEKTPEKPTKTQDLSKNVKRMGALAALGSLTTGKQRAGLNLGAVNTTAGAGLGGTGGSGGVQTSLYAKGIIAAPVGPGGNIQGAGGYGTKGKGGGQAGYGTLSLVGSAGTATIPLGQEAIVEGGLDRDLIAAVVMRNMGQVRFCYEQGLQIEPSLAGRVVGAWTINGQGNVVDPSVASTTLNSKTVEDCILMRLRTWKFPLPQGGVSVKVTFPFVLKRAGT